MQNTTYPPAISRTWAVREVTGCYGEVWGISNHTVTLWATGPKFDQYHAEIDGQPADLQTARRLVLGASRATVTAETVVLGRKRAHKMHKALGRLGHSQHYALASKVLGRTVATLAALTEEEARKVWAWAKAHAPAPHVA